MYSWARVYSAAGHIHFALYPQRERRTGKPVAWQWIVMVAHDGRDDSLLEGGGKKNILPTLDRLGWSNSGLSEATGRVYLALPRGPRHGRAERREPYPFRTFPTSTLLLCLSYVNGY